MNLCWPKQWRSAGLRHGGLDDSGRLLWKQELYNVALAMGCCQALRCAFI